MKKKGLTLAELLIAAVILSTLTAVTVPNFQAAKNKAQANQAVAYLRTIRSGEKMYAARYADEYIPASTQPEILNNIGVEVSTQDYKFKVVTISGESGAPMTFQAYAYKGDAPENCAGADICLKSDGTWEGTSAYKPTSAG